jgi:hypothetical protein
MDALSRHANINPIITSTGMIFNYSLNLFIFFVQFNYSLYNNINMKKLHINTKDRKHAHIYVTSRINEKKKIN